MNQTRKRTGRNDNIVYDAKKIRAQKAHLNEKVLTMLVIPGLNGLKRNLIGGEVCKYQIFQSPKVNNTFRCLLYRMFHFKRNLDSGDYKNMRLNYPLLLFKTVLNDTRSNPTICA